MRFSLKNFLLPFFKNTFAVSKSSLRSVGQALFCFGIFEFIF